MADWARSLQSGFQTGLQLGQTLRQRRLEDALAQEAAKYSPTEVVAGDEALRTFRENYVPPPGGPSAADYEAQYLGGLQQRPAGFTVGGQDYASLAAAEQAAAPQRAAGLANIYRQFGDVGRAEEMMGLSRQSQLQNLQIGAAQRAEDEALRLQTATQQIADLQKNTGVPPSLTDMRRIAANNNLSLDQQYKLGQNITGIAEQEAKALAQDINKKIKGKGLDALLKLHKDDPMFDDNSFFEASVDEKGKVTLIQKSNDGTVLGTQSFSNSAAAVEYLNKAAVDPANVYSWLQTSRLNETKIGQTEQQTRTAAAQEALYRSQAGAVSPTAQRQEMTQNIALADQYRKQLQDIDGLLANSREGSPQHTALIAQRNQINRALTDVNRLLSGQQAAPTAAGPNIEAARAAALSGINPATNKPWTTKDKADYELIFGEPFPERKGSATSAPPTGLTRPEPASPRMARAESGRITRIPPAPPEEITTRGGVRRTNPEYTAWVKKYGNQVGLQ